MKGNEWSGHGWKIRHGGSDDGAVPSSNVSKTAEAKGPRVSNDMGSCAHCIDSESEALFGNIDAQGPQMAGYGADGAVSVKHVVPWVMAGLAQSFQLPVHASQWVRLSGT